MSYIAATMDSIVGNLRQAKLVVLESTTIPAQPRIDCAGNERAGPGKSFAMPLLPDGVMVAIRQNGKIRQTPALTAAHSKGSEGWELAAEAAEALYAGFSPRGPCISPRSR